MAEFVSEGESSTRQLVVTERKDAVLRLTFENAPANALSTELMSALLASLQSAAANNEVRVVILASSGKLFSAGHDLKQMSAHRIDADKGRSYFEKVFGLCARLMQSIVDLPKPVIAEVGGVAAAAGCQLVASCDLAVASDSAKFAVNGIDVGLFCSTPAVALTRNVAQKFAMELLLTGDMIDALKAHEIGLVNRVVPHDLLRETVDDLAERIASKSPCAVKLGKKAVHDSANLGLADAYRLASEVMVENMLAADAEEGISAFFARRRPA